jgi:hypothetical protein
VRDVLLPGFGKELDGRLLAGGVEEAIRPSEYDWKEIYRWSKAIRVAACGQESKSSADLSIWDWYLALEEALDEMV